jgi:hypothetical protein
MDRCIGMDVHAMSCTVCIVGPSGRQLKSDVVETNGQALIEYLRAIPRPRHLCFEDGTQSAWLHEILSPHVDELVVVGVTESRGAKSDAKDALGLAQALRLGAIDTTVFKAPAVAMVGPEAGRVGGPIPRPIESPERASKACGASGTRSAGSSIKIKLFQNDRRGPGLP